jgi:hypothetical protein
MNGSAHWMKRLTLLLFPAVLWVGGCTCAGSLRPLESDEALTFTPDLSGTWMSNDGDSKEPEYITLESTGDHSYRVSYTKDGETLEDVYELSLVQVGSYTFFDAAFKETGNTQSKRTPYDLGVLPIHLIGRISADGGQLRLGLLSYDWMEKMSAGNSLKVPFVEHHEGDDRLILLTAESDKLKEFVRQYTEDPEAFSTVSTFRRVPSPLENSSGTKP